jgi:hypothetical protein
MVFLSFRIIPNNIWHLIHKFWGICKTMVEPLNVGTKLHTLFQGYTSSLNISDDLYAKKSGQLVLLGFVCIRRTRIVQIGRVSKSQMCHPSLGF